MQIFIFTDTLKANFANLNANTKEIATSHTLWANQTELLNANMKGIGTLHQ